VGGVTELNYVREVSEDTKVSELNEVRNLSDVSE
jgi:hypothetical protein